MDDKPKKVRKHKPNRKNTALIHGINPAFKSAFYQIKQARRYQNWVSTCIGPENLIAGAEYAIKHTREHFKVKNGEIITRDSLYFLTMIRNYMATNRKESFRVPELIAWLKGEGFMIHGLNLRQVQKNRMATLVNMHFLNPVGAKAYVMTMRSNMLFRKLMEHFRDFFGDEGDYLFNRNQGNAFKAPISYDNFAHPLGHPKGRSQQEGPSL